MAPPKVEPPIDVIDLSWLSRHHVTTRDMTALVSELTAKLGAVPGSRNVRGFDNKV